MNIEFELIKKIKELEQENDKLKQELKLIHNMTSENTHVREVRTFGNGIPKKDKNKFKILQQFNDDDDISFIVFEIIDIL